MALVHKQSFRKLNRDSSPYKGGESGVKEGDLLDVLNGRYISSEDGTDGVVESIKGTTSIPNLLLPAGTNTCIGVFQHPKENAIVYFIHNSNNNHGIYLYTKPTGLFTKLVENEHLAFDKTKTIDQGGVIDDIIIWTDRNQIKSIRASLAKSGSYNNISDPRFFNLVISPPIYPPICSFSADEGILINKICFDSYKFFYRFVYIGDTISSKSFKSKLMRGYTIPDSSNTFNNTINIQITIDENILPLIKSVEVGYVKNNDPEHYIFKIIRNPDESIINTTFVGDQFNKVLSDEDSSRIFDNVPEAPIGMALIKNRVVSVVNSSGFDIDESTFDIDLTINEFVPDEADNVLRGFFKDGATYEIGIVFGTNSGKRTFVKKRKTISFPYKESTPRDSNYGSGRFYSYTESNSTVVGLPESYYYLTYELTGTPPTGFDWYSIVLSENRTHGLYFECIAYPNHYFRDEEGADGSINYFTYRISGRKFYVLNSLSGEEPIIEATFLRIPDNVLFEPEKGDKIRIKNSGFTGIKAYEVLDFLDGVYIVIPKMIYKNKKIINFVKEGEFPLFIEVYRDPVINDSFFDIGEVVKIVDGVFSATEGTIDGDNYVLDDSRLLVNPDSHFVDITRINRYYTYSFSSGEKNIFNTVLQLHKTEFGLSTLPFFSSGLIKSPVGKTEFTSLPAYFDTSPEVTAFRQVADANKIASDRSTINTINDDGQAINKFGSLVFSEPYVQDTQINGIGTFDALNEYQIPVDRGPIRSLVRINDNLIAIHETETSSVYIGEGLIRQGADFVLVKTTDFIGDDRELEFSYGTINPESVLQIYGKAYWWDNKKGAVVQYTKAGLFAVSNFGMKNTFRQLAKLYEPYIDSVKIITGYDVFHDELLITFPDVYVSGVKKLSSVTWVYHDPSNSWGYRISYKPEGYTRINNDLYSFLNGQLWKHNSSTLYNNFYGVQYERLVKYYMNADIGKNKQLLNIHIDSDNISGSNEDYKVVVIKSTNSSGQETYIPAYEFEKDENKYYAPVLCDINTPAELLEPNQIALRSGEYLISGVFEVEIKSDRVDSHKMREINLIYKHQEFSI